MLSTAIIIFREVFEISMILSIIYAATTNLHKRNKFIISGLIFGIIISIFFSLALNQLANQMSEFGQDLINILTLSTTTLLIGWTVVWMSKNAKIFSNKIRQTSNEISIGTKPLYAISIIIASAVLREGTEIILFLSGIHASGTPLSAMLEGVCVGLLGGILVGATMYIGILRFNSKYIFKITSILLIFLAASMASDVANFLSSGNFISYLNEPIWDSSWLLSENSIVGKILHALIGYEAQPSGIQIIFYCLTIFAIIVSLNLKMSKNTN